MNKIFYALLVSVICLFTGIYLYLNPPFQSQEPIIETVTFDDLPGWGDQTMLHSFRVFRNSCASVVRQNKNKSLSTKIMDLKVEDMLPACHSALAAEIDSTRQAAVFFKQWFDPIEVRYPNGDDHGLFTGYYAPLLHGSLKRTDTYSIPIYTRPDSLVKVNLDKFQVKGNKKVIIGQIKNHELIPFHDRQAINEGAIKGVPVLVWVDNRIDRLFLEIQGSGTIQLADGRKMSVGYDGQNGQPYTALAAVLIRDGLMTRDNASMQKIRQYFNNHPHTLDKYLNQNQSFVFFKDLKQDAALGAQGLPLTPGYSLAVDRRYVPMGLPVWLSTTYPDRISDDHQPLNRLMIAQDTGGAIKGLIRGDVYWGSGHDATFTAGHMKNRGKWWLLVPKTVKLK